jgi:hypothetical protein
MKDVLSHEFAVLAFAFIHFFEFGINDLFITTRGVIRP